jgi:hypothetical protein
VTQQSQAQGLRDTVGRTNVSGTQTGNLEPVVARASPPWWARCVVYGILWLPVLVMMLVFVPRFEPIFMKLEECGELSWPTQWLMTFDRLNAACFYLPALLLAIALLAVDAVVVRHLRRKVRGSLWSWLWVAALALAAIPAMLLVLTGLLLPVFKMGQMVD